jgi:hypothetical protein
MAVLAPATDAGSAALQLDQVVVVGPAGGGASPCRWQGEQGGEHRTDLFEAQRRPAAGPQGCRQQRGDPLRFTACGQPPVALATQAAIEQRNQGGTVA